VQPPVKLKPNLSSNNSLPAVRLRRILKIQAASEEEKKLMVQFQNPQNDPGSDASSTPASGHLFTPTKNIRCQSLIDYQSCDFRLRSRIVKIQPKIQITYRHTNLNLKTSRIDLPQKNPVSYNNFQQINSKNRQDKQGRALIWQKLKLWSRRRQSEAQINSWVNDKENPEANKNKEVFSSIEKVSLDQSRQLTKKKMPHSVSRTSLDREARLIMKEVQTHKIFPRTENDNPPPPEKEIISSTRRKVNNHQKCLRKLGSSEIIPTAPKSPVRFRQGHLKPLIQKSDINSRAEFVDLNHKQVADL